nr:hypothetical protein [uncultured Draconibacterium sp.]
MGLSVALITSCEDDELFSIKDVLITWEEPADVIDGVALSETELSATANVPGTMVFTPALGTVLPKGDHTLTADFTPRESKYPSLTKTVTVTVVDKLIPVITWENPDVLALGTPLSEEQLNATADVEGTFVYTPPIGTVLPLGENQELKVDFTPSVITHQPTSKTVMINVRDVVPLRYADKSAVYTGLESLAFNVDGEVGSLGDNPEMGFTVHVTNNGKLVDKDIEVTGVSINAEDATQIELTLAQEIYADDIITVAFNQEGSGIVSTDEQPLLSFDAKQVSVLATGEDFLAGNAWAGFEPTAAPNTGGVAGYWVGALPHPWARTTDMFVSGEASMKFVGGFDDKPLYGMNFGDNVDTEPGAYEVSHKIYIEEGSDLKMIRTTIARKSNGWETDTETTWDVENIKRGEWVTIKRIMNFPVAFNNSDRCRYTYYVQADLNEGVTGDQTFYLDDMGLRKVDAAARP